MKQIIYKINFVPTIEEILSSKEKNRHPVHHVFLLLKRMNLELQTLDQFSKLSIEDLKIVYNLSPYYLNLLRIYLSEYKIYLLNENEDNIDVLITETDYEYFMGMDVKACLSKKVFISEARIRNVIARMKLELENLNSDSSRLYIRSKDALTIRIVTLNIILGETVQEG